MPKEFVSRNIRVERPDYRELLLSTDGPAPNYLYVRLGKIRHNFPVENYVPDAVAFMNPENTEIAMPPGERAKYWFEHLQGHESDHVERHVDRREQNEYGCNVAATRRLGMFDFFPIKGGYSPPNGLY